MKKLFLQSGKLMVGDFPEDVIPEPMRAGGKIAARSQREVDEYSAAVSAAMDRAVEVVNMDAITKEFLKGRFWFVKTGREDIEIKEGHIYDTPPGWTVDIEDFCASDCCTQDGACEHCRQPIKKARLVPLKEPENLIASQIPYPDQSDFCDAEEYFQACRTHRDSGGIVATGLPGFSKGWEGEKFSLLRDQETTASDRTEPDCTNFSPESQEKKLLTYCDKCGELKVKGDVHECYADDRHKGSIEAITKLVEENKSLKKNWDEAITELKLMDEWVKELRQENQRLKERARKAEKQSHENWLLTEEGKRLTAEDRSEPEEPAINVLIKISKQLDRIEGSMKFEPKE